MENNFSNNLKYIREAKKISQQYIADKIGVDRSTIGYWETGKVDPTMANVVKLSEVLGVDIITLIGSNLKIDNGVIIDVDSDTVQIPVLGTIKAGVAIEAQENILEYIDIPKSWLKGGKSFYGLQIIGDSMYPKYQEKDIVIFENTNDYTIANRKDCAVMVNGFDATFKNVTITSGSITLTPLNPYNSDGYIPTT